MVEIITEYPQFFTATNLKWQKLLRPDKYKDIITGSLEFLVSDQRIHLYAFVIMINHIHLIWQMRAGKSQQDVRRDFMKFTAQRIKADLQVNHPKVLDYFKVNAADREFQFWKRNPLSIELNSEKIFREKLEYLHLNPVRAGLCTLPEQYKYSSAYFYETGIDNWGFLTHYR